MGEALTQRSSVLFRMQTERAMDLAAIDTALRPLSAALEQDGYKVAVEVVGHGVAVRVRAGHDACKECLVPKSVMAELMMQSLSDAGLPVSREQLTLSYPDEAR